MYIREELVYDKQTRALIYITGFANLGNINEQLCPYVQFPCRKIRYNSSFETILKDVNI